MSAASGTALDDGVKDEIDAFMKTGNIKYGEKCPWIIFDIDKKDPNDKKALSVIKILEKGQNCQNYDDLIDKLQGMTNAYALAEYPLKDNQKDELTACQASYPVFINWSKDDAPIKKKMVYAASVQPLKNALSTACKATLESHEYDDICCDTVWKEIKRNLRN